MALEERPLTALRGGLCHCRCSSSKRTHTHTHAHTYLVFVQSKSGWSGLVFLFLSMGLLLRELTGCYCLVLCSIAVWHLQIWTFETFCFSLFLLNKLYHVFYYNNVILSHTQCIFSINIRYGTETQNLKMLLH